MKIAGTHWRAAAVLSVCATLWSTGVSAQPAPARALTSGATTCNIAMVSLPARGPRLMVKCDAQAPGAGGAKIEYFALNLGTDAERGRLMLSMLMTAKVAGRPVRIHYYTDDTTENAWGMGCNPQDCRPIVLVEMI